MFNVWAMKGFKISSELLPIGNIGWLNIGQFFNMFLQLEEQIVDSYLKKI